MTHTSRSLFQPVQRAPLTSKALIVHANDTWYDYLQTGHLTFFEKLGQGALDLGYAPQLMHSERLSSSLALAAPNCLHIMFGPKRHAGAKIFHAHPSYIPGFWYLDPKGYFWNSSLVKQRFDPAQVDMDRAQYFFFGVRGHIFRTNQSKRPQPGFLDHPLPPAKSAFLVQDIEKYKVKSWYVSTHDIIETLGRRQAERSYIKLHPILRPQIREQIVAQCAAYPNLELVDASVHDIIRAAQVIVSQNSAVGFEALFHEKPVITCAKTDYHHASLVAQTPAALDAAIDRAEAAFEGFAYEKYLCWFLDQQMLEPHKDSFTARALDRLGLC